MLHFTQHDKSESVIPSQSEESSAMWMLHYADAAFSMTSDVIPNAVRNPVVDASLRSA